MVTFNFAVFLKLGPLVVFFGYIRILLKGILI